MRARDAPGPRESFAPDAMFAAWSVPQAWRFRARNGLTGARWDQRTDAPHALPCGLGDDHLIFSVHHSGFAHVDVRVDGKRRYADAIARNSWMLVDTAGRPAAETLGGFDLTHIYVPKSAVARTCAAYELDPVLPDAAVCLYGRDGASALPRAALAVAQTMRAPDRHFQLALDSACQHFLTELVMALDSRRNPAPPTRLSPAQTRRVERYLDANLTEPIELADLAAAAGLSRYHFLRAFKADYGRPPMAEVTRRRLHRATELLARGELSITDVAQACGFSDHGHFAALFRRQYGQTPSAYRRAFALR